MARRIFPAALQVLVLPLVLLFLLTGFSASERPAVCGADLEITGNHDPALAETAAGLGIEHVRVFVKVLTYVNRHGRLPHCYLTKQAARKEGWRPGSNLWDSVPGGAIGGNRYHNRERLLPDRFMGRYRLADLDFAGTRRRDAKRLVWVERSTADWTLWVTVDHYDSFVRIDPR